MRLTEKDVGKRILYEDKPASRINPKEAKVLEVSPSKEFVKINPIDGNICWIFQSNYELFEELHSYDKTSDKYHLIGIDIATNEDDELVINGIPY